MSKRISAVFLVALLAVTGLGNGQCGRITQRPGPRITGPAPPVTPWSLEST